jgi:hypothetical protein
VQNQNGMNESEDKYDGVSVRNVSEAEIFIYLPVDQWPDLFITS